MTEYPDFEAVYHLVIDAVDHFNESWGNAYREQLYLFENSVYLAIFICSYDS